MNTTWNSNFRLKNSATGPKGLPPELEYINGKVFTRGSGLKAYTRLGPLKGKVCLESEVDFDEDRSHVWLLHCEVGHFKYCFFVNLE